LADKPEYVDLIKDRTRQHWRRPVSPTQLGERLDQAHRPYHEAIDQMIRLLLDRFGCALLIDCHSMPPPPADIPEIVFGDCRGRTADAWLSSEALEVGRRCGFAVGLNDPFAGGHVIERHARPAFGVQALQLEIDRRCYLNDNLKEPGPGFDRVAKFIDRLAIELGEALLSRRFATAAE